MQSFRRIVLCVLIALTPMFLISCSTSDTLSTQGGSQLMSVAESYEESGSYIQASAYYELARKAFLKEGNEEQARACQWKMVDMQKITANYCISQDKLFDAMKGYNQNYTQDDLNTWLAEGRLEYMMIDGTPWYFNNCFTNLSYGYPEVLARDTKLQGSIDMFTGLLRNYLDNRQNSQAVLSNPKRYEVTHTVAIPRNLLPTKGNLRIWLPYPIEADSQTDIEMVSITPAQYYKQGPDIHADIGCVYFEIPLAQLKTDLNMEVKFRFTRYEVQYQVDPALVSAYDKTSELYIKYTGESQNTVITPEIRQKAMEIVGGETNPYLQVQLINKYMLENIKYGLFPYTALEALNYPASVYVHEKGYGDCGAQGIYFAALCRSLGIPARTTGGKEMVVPGGSGHLWAEYYLPGYGWVPVDPSLRDVVALSKNTTPQEREMLADYLGGNLDPFRLTFQKDVDLDLIPPTEDPVYFSVIFQTPKAECREMEGLPTGVVAEHHTCKVEQINP